MPLASIVIRFIPEAQPMCRGYLRVFRGPESRLRGRFGMPPVRPGGVSLTLTGQVVVLVPPLAYVELHRGLEFAGEGEPAGQLGGGKSRAFGPRSHVASLPRRRKAVMKG